MADIINHKKEGNIVSMEDKYIVSKRLKNLLRQTTIGWKFLVECKDGSRQWMDLKIMKESNPVEVAEYIQAHNLTKQPAFAWWVPYTLLKRDVIVAAVNSRVKRKSHKNGIEVPNYIKYALWIDRSKGNTIWATAL